MSAASQGSAAPPVLPPNISAPNLDDHEGLDESAPPSNPTTISAWRSAQLAGDGLARLCALAAWQRSANSATHTWVSLATDEHIREQWQALESRNDLPLYGVPFAVQDNIDAIGFTITAACPKFATAPASNDAAVVERLKTAGAILIGKTNLDQSTNGLVGTHSPRGPFPNTFDRTGVSGGSSSSSTVVVARGVVPFALGTDIDGSGRVPAGLNNIYGLKPTRGAISSRGVVSGCQSLDSVSIFTSTVGDAETVLSLAEGFDEKDPYSRHRPESILSSETGSKDFGAATMNGAKPRMAIDVETSHYGASDYSDAYASTLQKARHLGWVLVPRDFSSLFALARLIDDGPSVAECCAGVKEILQKSGRDNMDPTVRAIITKAEDFSDTYTFAAEGLRQKLTRQIQLEFQGFDGILLPTVSTLPTLEQISQGPIDENSKLGTRTSCVSSLEWTAIAIPAGVRQDGLSLGLMLISSQWQEPKLLQLARQWAADEKLLLEAASITTTEPATPTTVAPLPEDNVQLAVVGASDITDLGGWKAYMAKYEKVPFPRRRITRVLIANRGEIAARIIRTLRRMNIEAVAIYSDADADTAHVRDADIALRLPGSTIAETYINGGQVLRLAKSVSADAIIPGYGFLAENADFARRVEAEGIIWVGPTPQQMSELGLKHRARSIAAEAGVPIVPGSGGPITNVDDAMDEARRIGFPLMLKSSAGGGGIGLRHCEGAKDLEEAFQSVQRLAAANFCDSSVILERFIASARHVEVQILGDGTGRVIAAGDRDCSLQRRHQKIVEESPALMVPNETRVQMRDAAIRLASAVKYLSVGTVEFLFDVDTQNFYFLEVNTRLQVEHPITEAVTGLDLVEAMIEIATDGGQELFQRYPDGIVPTTDVAIEARLYAEDPWQDFRPCAGRILELELPLSGLRVDTWLSCGTEVSTSYDPMLAKLIAKGRDRREAVARLAEGLAATRVAGLETNLDYLRQLVESPMFQSGSYMTQSLDDFRFTSASFRVVEPGTLTTIQDCPGRTGYWNVGVPPCGPIDDLSFRLANRLVNNQPNCAGLECSITGPSLTFHCDVVIAVVGASAWVHIDDKRVPMNQALYVSAGSTLKVGLVESGSRSYIAIRRGIDVPCIMGSRSTFELGQMGGFGGRKLQHGDHIPLGDLSGYETIDDGALPVAPAVPIPPQPKAEWTIGVLPGPHGAPDYLTVEGLDSLFNSKWTVHYNSNRLGIRLKGPRPQWARLDGGEAGLHPSNIHDSPYSIGSVSFTGDDAVVLTCDGPSLGGFVVFCVVASAEMWKLGQVRPGDTIRLRPITVAKALERNSELLHAIEDLTPLSSLRVPEDEHTSIANAKVLGTIQHNEQRIVVRQAGDSAVLLEFGDANAFSLRRSFEILAFIQHHQTQQAIPGVEELTPGVCTLHVRYLLGTSPQAMLDRLTLHVRSYAVPNQVPSRHVRLPLAFDDDVTRAAIERYAATIRADAPWLPSNIDFIGELNGVERDVLQDILESSEFLVLGLGDVYLGSPCAVPLDPRHRLFGSKYNPSRTFTPKGAVGIGGQYMCIYAADSPGGYQLVGRTIDNIWDPSAANDPTGGSPQTQCLFRIFDQITFYPITETELNSAQASGTQRQLVRVEDGVLDLAAHEAWVNANHQDIAATAAQRARAIKAAPFLDELIRPREEFDATGSEDGCHGAEEEQGEDDGCERVKAGIPGRMWKVFVKEGDEVKAGSVLANLESCKMDVKILSPVDGDCVKVHVKEGAVVDAHDTLMVVRPHCREKPRDN